ncbi:MAG: hypothetical protein RBU35_23415 [Anaerolineae bacterium]|jgi:hypothetical protein|nr:hypothetical protein [Anaerolineae bacterium]
MVPYHYVVIFCFLFVAVLVAGSALLAGLPQKRIPGLLAPEI